MFLLSESLHESSFAGCDSLYNRKKFIVKSQNIVNYGYRFKRC